MRVKNYYTEETENYFTGLYCNGEYWKTYIKECYQNEKDCLAIVQEDCSALYYIKQQTTEMCMAAVQQSGYSLMHVKNQTPEICMAAVQQSSYTLHYVKDDDLKLKIKKELNL